MNRNTVQQVVTIDSRAEVAEGMFVLRFVSAEIAGSVKPGQFVNIRAAEAIGGPLLRRPFSVSRVEGDKVELFFNVIGTGTRLLSSKRVGDRLDVLGPLGKPYGLEDIGETAILVGGGLGVAPFPLLTTALVQSRKQILTLIGSRTKKQLYSDHLQNVHIATDDGSKGFKGNVVELLENHLAGNTMVGAKIFGCGPTRMLMSLTSAAKKWNIPCELSLEGDMACGIGICQGCPVEVTKGKKKYSLVCTDGPTFNCLDVVLHG
ncbi:MAG: dihydroorotate dehydrogenase electron transfer subunit [Bacteroidota bacterium]